MSTSYAFTVLRAEDQRVRTARQGDRNNTLFSAAARLGSYVATGEIAANLVVNRLTDAGLVCGLGHLEISQTIASGLHAGRSHPRRTARRITNRPTALTALDRIERIVCGQPWAGSDGRLTYLTLRSVIHLARQFGGPGKIPIACRRLAAEMGTDKNRAGRGLTLARRAGWLRTISAGTWCQPAVYTLRVPPTLALSQSPATITPIPVGGVINDAGTGHDAFHPKALGDIGTITLDHLSRHGNWLTRRELSAATGLLVNTLNKHLCPTSPLVAQNLVETRRNSLRATPMLSINDLDRAAATLGTQGANDKLRRRIADEYRKDGRLNADGNWCDPLTGDTIGGRPDWLPEVSNHAA